MVIGTFAGGTLGRYMAGLLQKLGVVGGNFVVIDVLDAMSTYWYGYHAGEPTADAAFHIDVATLWAGLSEEERTMRAELAEATLTVMPSPVLSLR